jgi:hypothetical protein
MHARHIGTNQLWYEGIHAAIDRARRDFARTLTTVTIGHELVELLHR